jgi:hypothetical protein
VLRGNLSPLSTLPAALNCGAAPQLQTKKNDDIMIVNHIYNIQKSTEQRDLAIFFGSGTRFSHTAQPLEAKDSLVRLPSAR